MFKAEGAKATVLESADIADIIINGGTFSYKDHIAIDIRNNASFTLNGGVIFTEDEYKHAVNIVKLYGTEGSVVKILGGTILSGLTQKTRVLRHTVCFATATRAL